MRKLLLIVLLLPQYAVATNYYVSNSGNDLANGLTTATAWRTIEKVNSFSYAWSKVSGPTAGTISSPTAASTNLTGLTQGTYLYQLTVTDNNGATARDTVQVKVNRAPTANAGTDKTVNFPTSSTTLAGTGTDIDGTISSYAWAKISGPTTGTITSPNSANTGLSSLVQGTYRFQLTVTDNNAAIGRDTVQVTVNGNGNQPPIANAGVDKVINLPSSSTTLTGSGTDPNGTIRSYAWAKISGPSSGSIATPNSATTSLNSLVQGTYLFQLTVTDNSFAIGRDTVQVKVNRLPTANAGSDKTITLPSNSTSLTGTGTDVDGTISSYAWAKISGPASGTINSPNSATTTLTNLSQGTYLDQLTVTDNNGAIGRDTVQVRVNAASTLVFIKRALPLKAGPPYVIRLNSKKLTTTDLIITTFMPPVRGS